MGRPRPTPDFSPRLPATTRVHAVPNPRIVGQTEFGAAWKKTSASNQGYLSVKLDDPSFPAPIYASLVDAEEGYSLIWSRGRNSH